MENDQSLGRQRQNLQVAGKGKNITGCDEAAPLKTSPALLRAENIQECRSKERPGYKVGLRGRRAALRLRRRKAHVQRLFRLCHCVNRPAVTVR